MRASNGFAVIDLVLEVFVSSIDTGVDDTNRDRLKHDIDGRCLVGTDSLQTPRFFGLRIGCVLLVQFTVLFKLAATRHPRRCAWLP